jgi:hypothetical protein
MIGFAVMSFDLPAVKTSGNPMDKAEMIMEIMDATGKHIVFELRDEAYIRLDHDSLMAFVSAYKRYRLVGYQPEWRDCDDFSSLFIALIPFTAPGEHEAARAAFEVDVRLPEGLHSVVLCFTDKGAFVIEPQAGDVLAVADYAMRSNIIRGRG